MSPKMKRCPTCNRIETDDALAFCRADGTTLVSDSSSLNNEAGTAQLTSAPATEVETSILPHRTNAAINRSAAQTTVLPTQSPHASIGGLSSPKRHKGIRFVIAGVIVAALAVSIYVYLARKNKTFIDSIAVLPFQNVSDDPNVEYLSDGIAESLINSLTQLQQLKVIARSTAFRYKGKDADPQVVGRELNVRAVLTGRVRQVGDRLIIQVDLVDHTSLGLLYHHQWRWAESEQEFRQAIALNPNYPTAHHWFSVYFRARRQFVESLKEIKRAQELDPLSPNISNNLAMVYLLKNDTNSAVGEWQKLIELDPNFPYAHANLGFAYIRQQRYEEGIAEFQKAVELSGRASSFLSSLGYGYAVTGRREEALQILKKLEERYAKGEANGQYIARVYAGLGDRDQVFAWLEKDFRQRSGLLPLITWWFGFDDLRLDPRYGSTCWM